MNINFKSKKTWIIIVAAVLVIVAVVLIIRTNRKKKNEEETKKIADSTSTRLPEASWPLKPRTSGYSTENGSYGWQIKLLQKSLNDINGSELTLDGKFGPLTKLAVNAAFPGQISDDEISQAEFEGMLETIREAYAEIGMTYASNDELKSPFKQA